MAIVTETIQLPAEGGRSMPAYLARPEGNGPFPILVVIMEGFGLNGHMQKVADQYAAEGYAAISPDLYFRETGPRVAGYDNLPKAIEMLLRLKDSEMTADIGRAIDYLKAQPFANPSQIGTVGYCMGGRASFLMATVRDDISATVSYYGGRIVGGVTANTPEAPIARAANIKNPVLAFWGETDQSIPLDQVAEAEQVMRQLGKDYESIVYPGADHGFNCDERSSYNAPAAADAWERSKSFFAKHLKS